MKIAVAGASGRAGSEITKELSRRGHTVTAIARNPEKIATLPNVTPTKGDVLEQSDLAKLWAGHDVAVSSVHFLASDALKLIGAAKDSKVGHYLVVGGAGSLEVAPGVKLVTTPAFPAQYKAEAEAGSAFLDLLRQEKALNWTFISPSALFIEGERTGKFRLGTDQLLADANGKSWITFADYAIALADEIERPAHERQRFTVGY
ncbi:NAD(P)-dependent oxidoreductase [Bradyrhizobium sp. 4]|uniref:NAD(P)-dependent oxidoreductase n=1 Tax=unclassified Bradyrhizobium TaxID=2631580 RepID=UPI001FFADAD2|nr:MULTISPECIES: NAD(P)-dependent oxidoreductase [unclassified Bradyrhizobium]MCK1403085.1 NAD(P)-dependent oxidoreductase [Bradyrhizobium sp. 39]MCK1748680.1 NAD(P)-dependent oxidoreductase [Bradyrhizobium sp. 135]UPJ33127.1 NAD(P)-dependent oxidoreductase [Bradyrhizobium sp. 4]